MVPGDAKSLCQLDLDKNGSADFIMTTNNGTAHVLFGPRSEEPSTLAIRLMGEKKNRDAVGARVTLTLSDGSTQTSEVHAGGSYLSQSAPDLFFAAAKDALPGKVDIVWPTGKKSTHKIPKWEPSIEISME